MVAGPCCVFGATATDAPPDVVVGEGAASDGVASFDHFEEERGGTSSSEDDEELKITKIVSHRDTRGHANTPEATTRPACSAFVYMKMHMQN